MSKLEDLLRAKARQLLADEEVDVIVGYESGTMALRTTPCFIRDPDQTGRLVWNQSCENNLAKYLHNTKGKVGIVAKGCDARAVVGEILERQIPREDVVIIGVPCNGVIDRRKVNGRLGGREARESETVDGRVVLRGADFEEALEVAEVLFEGCLSCQHRVPPVYDVLIGEGIVDNGEVDVPVIEDVTVQQLESWSPDQRWEYFSSEFSRCIRCNACRQACPCCYCATCFVDATQPSWFGKSHDLSDVMAFHLGRAYHMAGRCVDCGACVRACPMHIDLRALGRMVEEEARESFDHEAGMDLESLPPLSTFDPDDPQDFIK